MTNERHEGDGWSVTIAGNAPVQGDGVVDGLPFYFRARWSAWSFRIAADPIGNPVTVGEVYGSRDGWTTGGEYGDRHADASWMTNDHARRIIEACIRRWREVRDEPRNEFGVGVFEVDDVPSGPEAPSMTDRETWAEQRERLVRHAAGGYVAYDTDVHAALARIDALEATGMAAVREAMERLAAAEAVVEAAREYFGDDEAEPTPEGRAWLAALARFDALRGGGR